MSFKKDIVKQILIYYFTLKFAWLLIRKLVYLLLCNACVSDQRMHIFTWLLLYTRLNSSSTIKCSVQKMNLDFLLRHQFLLKVWHKTIHWFKIDVFIGVLKLTFFTGDLNATGKKISYVLIIWFYDSIVGMTGKSKWRVKVIKHLKFI